jgi:hypothetical protein
MILHGIYDNGRIILIEKNLPKVKANVKIDFVEDERQKKILDIPVSISVKKLRGLWKNRKDINDSSEWVQTQRKLTDKRLK